MTLSSPSTEFRRLAGLAAMTLVMLAITGTAAMGDPLPSWNDGASKQAILDFVTAATDPDSESYVAPADRIATLDNDGTLWAEKPTYFQLYFMMDRVKQLSDRHPHWTTTQPFKAVLDEDAERLQALTRADLMELLLATHGDTAPAEFDAAARDFLATARHPRFGVPYTDLTYQPMIELLEYLRANGFRAFIVSGGGIDFVRAFAEEAYGIPRENVVGSSLEYEFRDAPEGSDVFRLPAIGSVDDRDIKPANIALHIGRRPVIAVGNSDGDLQMLQYADDRDGPSLMLLVHHDDAEREYDYDHGTEAALEMARDRNWTIVSIARDFRTVFTFQAR